MSSRVTSIKVPNASALPARPCETRTSTCRSFATISSGLYRFLVIAVLLDVKDIPQVGLLQWGRINRGSEFCGNPERHEYELYLAVEDIDHSRTKTKSPQTICERFHKTALNECYRVAFRKKVYRSIDELQADLDLWIREYNEQRPHQGRWCFGKTPMQTSLDAMPMTKEKMIAA